MEDLFKHVRCAFNKPVKLACFSQTCQLSPFVCSQSCQCYRQHDNECRVKSVQQLTKDMLKVLQFQFLVMYSPILKASSINVIGRYAEQTLPRVKNQQFALTFDPINIKNNLNEIYFRLKKVKSCVGIGIFIQQTMVKNGFRQLPDEKYMNHGAYMLLSNNYLFSSSYEEQNCIQSSKLNLKQNDIIHIRLIISDNSNKIQFTQQNSGRKQVLSLDWKQNLIYHFGVYLYDEGDSVEILNIRI